MNSNLVMAIFFMVVATAAFAFDYEVVGVFAACSAALKSHEAEKE